jgi:hypothetical protein
MQKYVTQLLEMLQEAHNNRPAPRYLELPDDMECLRDVSNIRNWLLAGKRHSRSSESPVGLGILKCMITNSVGTKKKVATSPTKNIMRKIDKNAYICKK